MDRFKMVSEYVPRGDQPQAIESLARGVMEGHRDQILLGVTGSGKTFTMAGIIESVQKPTLVLAHNKTLAAQLCAEFRDFFPNSAVEYFVSYYDYYQPEAYIPSSDTYIEKDASINREIDRLRHSATAALAERRDVIVVSSVSCIYSLGDPKEYQELSISLREGQARDRDDLISALVDIQYERNDYSFERGTFRVRGDVVEIIPAGVSDHAVRVEFFGDEIERLCEINILTGEIEAVLAHAMLFPASHYATSREKLEGAISTIQKDLESRVAYLKENERLLEAQRLLQRTSYDIEMMREVGFCSGIENYSRYFDGRKEGDAPFSLLSYFPDDFLLFIDESHVTLPQVRAMYNGDFARKDSLVEYGFRLPSAYDNRPLKFHEFESRVPQVIYVSATPGPYEMERATQVVEQIIRPTGLVDPEIIVRPATGQVDDLLGEVRDVAELGNRALVTTLTKNMAESLTAYLKEMGVRVRYLHSEVQTLDRMRILRALRSGDFDVLVGINLLREGLDLPEVSLVAILDADKEGFLRSVTSLIQTIGRAARHVDGKVIMYADKITDSMRLAIDETNRRRNLQMEYNQQNGITPQSVHKAIQNLMVITKDPDLKDESAALNIMTDEERLLAINKIEEDMLEAAARLEFEKAASLRDKLLRLRGEKPVSGEQPDTRPRRSRRRKKTGEA